MDRIDTVYGVCAKIRELEYMFSSGAIRGFSVTRGNEGYVCEIKLHGLPTYDIAIKEVPGLAHLLRDEPGQTFATDVHGFHDAANEDFNFTVKL